MKEIWKFIPNYEYLYKISNYGNIVSLRGGREKKIYKSKNTHGYEIINLSKNGISKRFTVHYLVAITFIPKPKDKWNINHKNTLRDDNRVENLEWCTHKENMNPIKKRTSTRQSKRVKCIETGQIFKSCTEACKFLKCSNTLFSSYIHGELKHIKNFHFEIV